MLGNGRTAPWGGSVVAYVPLGHNQRPHSASNPPTSADFGRLQGGALRFPCILIAQGGAHVAPRPGLNFIVS